MTVTTSLNKTQPLGNGVTVSFPFSFRIFAATNLVVTSTDIATGVDTPLVLNTDYTVTGVGSYNGGNVVFGVAPVTGVRLTIRRVLPVTQQTDLRNSGAYFAEMHEDVFDRQTMIDQQQEEQFSRALLQPASDAAPIAALPTAAARALKVLAFNEAGDPIASTTDAANMVAAQTAATDAANSASAAAASLAAAGLPGSLVGKALNWLRAKADELGYELRTAVQARGDLGAAPTVNPTFTGTATFSGPIAAQSATMVNATLSGTLTANAAATGGHVLRRTIAEQNQVLTIDGNTGFLTAQFSSVGATGYAVQPAAMFIGRNTVSGRSIDAGGTLNASGADYAEYMRKAPACGTIAKGQIVGITAAGEVTDRWADAIAFMVKSTDPSYVGGDTWATEDKLGRRPAEPIRKIDVIEAPLVSDAIAATDDAPAVDAVYENVLIEAGDTDAQWAQKEAIYAAELDAFNVVMEAARQKVDRIAFAGQVPVNVMGATPGHHIIPIQSGDDIAGLSVANPTFDQYMISVGKVIAIETDGRARIIVKTA